MLLILIAASLILIEQIEEVNLHLLLRPLRSSDVVRRPANDVVVVRQRVVHTRRLSTRRRPPCLRHHDLNPLKTFPLHRVDERVDARVEQVVVHQPCVAELAVGLEQRVIERDPVRVRRVGLVRVEIHH
ncbi:hypothetical protein LINPERHAP2_LOCUS18044 [Linum perenne]